MVYVCTLRHNYIIHSMEVCRGSDLITTVHGITLCENTLFCMACITYVAVAIHVHVVSCGWDLTQMMKTPLMYIMTGFK